MRSASSLLGPLFLACLVGCGTGGTTTPAAPAGGGGGVPPPPAPLPALLAGATETRDSLFVHIDAVGGGTTEVSSPGLVPMRGADVAGLTYDTNANAIYAAANGNDLLMRVDRTTGHATPIGPIGWDDVRSLAFDPNTNSLYGIDFATSRLIEIDRFTGRGSDIPSFFPNVIGLAFDAGSNTLYGVTLGDELYTIDPVAGTRTLVGPLVAAVNPRGLTFHPPSNTLFSLDVSTNQLIGINPATALAAPIGSFGAGIFPGRLAWDEDTGTLWAVGFNESDTLFSLDTSTGAGGAPVGPVGPVIAEGLAHDPNTGRFYICGAGGRTLYHSDGVAGTLPIRVGPTGLAARIGCLAFDPNTDTLFGVEEGGDNLVTLDTTTGAATMVGPVGFRLIRGLAFDPVGNVLYGHADLTDELIAISTTTGSGGLVGAAAGPVGIQGLGFDPAAGTLYGFDELTARVVEISTSTGAVTPRGPSGQRNAWALTYDSIGNRLLGIETSSNQMLTFDTASGRGAGFGSMGISDVLAMAYDPVTDRFYGLDLRGGLLDVDPVTGESTILAETVPSIGGEEALAFDPVTNTLFALAGSGDLLTVDTSTGAVTVVGNTGFFAFRALAFDPATNTLYGARFRNLISINPVTAAAVDLGTIGGITSRVTGLSYNPVSGRLLGTTNAKEYVEIDPVTVAATVVGSTGMRTVGALAYRPGP